MKSEIKKVKTWKVKSGNRRWKPKIINPKSKSDKSKSDNMNFIKSRIVTSKMKSWNWIIFLSQDTKFGTQKVVTQKHDLNTKTRMGREISKHRKVVFLSTTKIGVPKVVKIKKDLFSGVPKSVFFRLVPAIKLGREIIIHFSRPKNMKNVNSWRNFFRSLFRLFQGSEMWHFTSSINPRLSYAFYNNTLTLFLFRIIEVTMIHWPQHWKCLIR